MANSKAQGGQTFRFGFVSIAPGADCDHWCKRHNDFSVLVFWNYGGYIHRIGLGIIVFSVKIEFGFGC